MSSHPEILCKRLAAVFLCLGLAAAQTLAANPGDVVISKVFRTEVNKGFIELYNNSNAFISLEGWKVFIAYAGGDAVSNMTMSSVGIAPRGRVFLPSTIYVNSQPYIMRGSELGNLWGNSSNYSGQVQLRDQTNQTIDGVAFGNVAKNIYGEGSVAPAPSYGIGLTRKSTPTGLQDTNDNASDFELVANLGPDIASVSVNTASTDASPSAYNGVTYVGGGDGKIHALVTSGTPMPEAAGFPIILKSITGSGTTVLMGRPAIRILQGTAYLFFCTSDGCLVRIRLNPDGSLDTSTGSIQCRALGAPSTERPTVPAVFPAEGTSGYQDYAFAVMPNGSSAELYKVPALDMFSSLETLSFEAGTRTGSSPSVNGVNLFVGIRSNINGLYGGLYRIQPSNLIVLTTLASGEPVSSSPMVSHTANSGFFQNIPVMYVATDRGNLYALNADTGAAALTSFGTNGCLALSPENPLTSVFLHNNTLYVSEQSRPYVHAVNARTGASTVFFNGSAFSTKGISGGVVVDPLGTVCFGTNYGSFYQIPVDHPDQMVIYRTGTTISTGSSFNTTPTIDTVNGYVLTLNSNGYLYRIPRY